MAGVTSAEPHAVSGIAHRRPAGLPLAMFLRIVRTGTRLAVTRYFSARLAPLRGPMGPPESRPSAARPRHILVVEDSDDLRTLMVLLLEAEGYRVDAAATAAEALERFDRWTYDLVLTDYALPGRSGAWLLREAAGRQCQPFRCAVIITAHPNPSDTEGFEVIRKPLEFDGFLARVRALLGSGDEESSVRCIRQGR